MANDDLYSFANKNELPLRITPDEIKSNGIGIQKIEL